jgi:predicted nucleic acid-binding protein
LSAFVADASVASAWILPDEDTAFADKMAELMAAEGAIVPDLFWHEIRNVLLTAERRQRIHAEYSTTALARLLALPIETAPHDDSFAVLQLARRHGLTAYDAAYLALAITKDLPLASLDKRVLAAARAEGIGLPPASAGSPNEL